MKSVFASFIFFQLFESIFQPGLLKGLSPEPKIASTKVTKKSRNKNATIMNTPCVLKLPQIKLIFAAFFLLEILGMFTSVNGQEISALEISTIQNFIRASLPGSDLSDYGDDVCQQTRFTCEFGSITSFNPYVKNATSIPPQFSNLKNLKKLGVYGNITGTIPPELSVLQNIEEFSIQYSYRSPRRMSGSIPAELSTWNQIRVFEFSSENFPSNESIIGTIPCQLSTWTNLQKFDVRFNNLTGEIPKQFSTWEKIQELNISVNEFSGSLPDEFSVWMKHNQSLHFTPQKNNDLCISVFLQRQLKNVKIKNSDFISLPNCLLDNIYEFAKLESETLLNFRENFRNKLFYDSWKGKYACAGWIGVECSNGSVTALEFPWQFEDISTSIPPQFSDLRNLRKIIFVSQEITGTIPTELSLLDMEHFEIIIHTLWGTLPPQFSVWKNIKQILLGYIHQKKSGLMSGPLPEQYSVWKKIQEFNIFDNQFTGTLPKQLTEWQLSQEIDLRKNNFYGQVPEEFSKFRYASRLFLAPRNKNQLCISNILQAYLDIYFPYRLKRPRGPRIIYSDILELPVCSNFTYQYSNASKTLESEVLLEFGWGGIDACNWIRSSHYPVTFPGIVCYSGSVVAISTSSLKVPPEFSKLKNLQEIYLSMVTGTLPPELSVLDIQNFFVTYHHLVGSLPREYSTWKNLRDLRLDGSRFSQSGGLSGPLPEEYSVFSKIIEFSVDSNQLQGNLPRQYSTWGNGLRAAFGNNSFTGPVPEEYSIWKDYEQFYTNNTRLCAHNFVKDFLFIEIDETDVNMLPTC